MQVIRATGRTPRRSLNKFLSGGRGVALTTFRCRRCSTRRCTTWARRAARRCRRVFQDALLAQLRLDYVLINERLHAACGWRACSRHAGEAAGAAHRAKLKTENKLAAYTTRTWQPTSLNPLAPGYTSNDKSPRLGREACVMRENFSLNIHISVIANEKAQARRVFPSLSRARSEVHLFIY